jgi:hypothetical protein
LAAARPAPFSGRKREDRGGTVVALQELIIMATAWFAGCPHCNTSLSYLEGVARSSMTPSCPRCGKLVPVTRPTFLMADNSRPAAKPVAKKP